MSVIKDKPNKQALLKDLERIHESLKNDDFDEDIPILTDSVIDAEDSLYDEKQIFEGNEDFEEFVDEAESDETIPQLDDEVFEDEDDDSEQDVLEGQQSLFGVEDEFVFDDLNATGIRAPIQHSMEHEHAELPAAYGENPFLPQHIRERLTQGKNSFLEDIALVNESLNKTHTRDSQKPEIKVPTAKTENQKLVDDLVAEFLPQIEVALRQRLMQVVDKKTK